MDKFASSQVCLPSLSQQMLGLDATTSINLEHYQPPASTNTRSIFALSQCGNRSHRKQSRAVLHKLFRKPASKLSSHRRSPLFNHEPHRTTPGCTAGTTSALSRSLAAAVGKADVDYIDGASDVLGRRTTLCVMKIRKQPR